MPNDPAPGDLLVRNSINLRFEVVDFQGQLIDAPFQTLARAIMRARFHASARNVAMWQQPIDERGRPLAPPGMLLPRRTAETGT